MNKVFMKRNAALFLVLTLSVAFSIACSKNANTGNTTSGTTNSGQTTSTSTTTTTSGGTTASSPTAAVRAYYQAAMDKDVMAAKRYLSSGRAMFHCARPSAGTLPLMQASYFVMKSSHSATPIFSPLLVVVVVVVVAGVLVVVVVAGVLVVVVVVVDEV